MRTHSSCPPLAEYRNLLAGEAVPADVERMAEHLENCSSCSASVQALLTADKLLDELRETPLPIEGSKTHLPAGLVARICALHSDKDQATVSPEGGTDTEETYPFLAPPQQPDEIGRLGAYRVLRVLGSGGMGIVFEAEDTTLQRRVALKVMKPVLAANERAKKRFLTEARAAARIKSEHVVTIYASGEDRGVPFVAMEFLQGDSLDTWLNQPRQLTPEQVCGMAREMAFGLAAAHKQGLIHRDIKPANIWVEAPSGRLKLLDFGLARIDGQSVQQTQPGVILGTPAYMAPEQANGQPLDARTDLFSLGCVLYRLLTGKLPFRGDSTLRILRSLELDTPTPVSQLNPDVPPDLSDLVMRLLSKDPAGRPASANAVLAELEVGPASRAGPERPARLPGPTPWTRRRTNVLLGTAAFVVLLLLAPVVLLQPTKHGVLRIEIDDDAIEATLTKNGYKIKGAGKEDIKVEPGEKTLKIKCGDAEFETERFVVKKGETLRLKIELIRGKVQVSQGEVILGQQWLGKYALEFDGKATVRLDDVPLDQSKPFTMELYATPTQKATAREALLCWDRKGDNEYRDLSIEISTFRKPPTLQYSWRFPQGVGNTLVEVGRRYHIAAVHDGKQVRFYIDGVLNGSRDGVTLPADPAKVPLDLGHSFHGTIDEVRLSKTARYDRDFIPGARFKTDPDTIGLYLFDEGKGEVLKDTSGNKLDGTINGAKWIGRGNP